MKRVFNRFLDYGSSVMDGLSRALQIDVSYLVREGFWLYAGYGGVLLIRLALILVLAHVVGREFYGQYQFIITVLYTTLVFALPGTETAIVQSVARGYDSSLIIATRERLKWSLVGSLVLIGVSAYFKFINPKDFWYVFIALAAIFPFYAAYPGITAYYRGKEEFGKAARYEFLVMGISTLVAIAALFAFKSLSVLIISMFAAVAIIYLVVYNKIVRDINQNRTDKAVISYSRHMTFMTALNYVAPYADRFIITWIAGFEFLAIYTVAMALMLNLSFGGKLLTTLLLPKLSRAHSGHSHRIKSLFWWFCLASVLMVAVIIFITPWLLPFVFSEKYVESVKYAQVALIYLAFFLPSSVLYAFFQARKKIKLLYVYNLGTGIANLVLLGVFVPFFGVWGAVISKGVLGFLGFVFLVVAFYQKNL